MKRRINKYNVWKKHLRNSFNNENEMFWTAMMT